MSAACTATSASRSKPSRRALRRVGKSNCPSRSSPGACFEGPRPVVASRCARAGSSSVIESASAWAPTRFVARATMRARTCSTSLGLGAGAVKKASSRPKAPSRKRACGCTFRRRSEPTRWITKKAPRRGGSRASSCARRRSRRAIPGGARPADGPTQPWPCSPQRVDRSVVKAWRRGHALAGAATVDEARRLPVAERIAQLESLRRTAIEQGWQTSRPDEVARVRARFLRLGGRVGGR